MKYFAIVEHNIVDLLIFSAFTVSIIFSDLYLKTYLPSSLFSS